MYRQSHPHYHGGHYGYYPRPAPHSGLMGVFGGVINLTTATLYGGARVVRVIVEGSAWHGAHGWHHSDCCDPCHTHHYYHYECRPPHYPCC